MEPTPKHIKGLPSHLKDQISLLKSERRVRLKYGLNVAILAEDAWQLDYDVDKSYKGNAGKDYYRGSI